MERAIKEKMSIHQEMQTTMPRDLINAKPVTAAVREFLVPANSRSSWIKLIRF